MDDDDTSSNVPLLLVEGSSSDGSFRLQKKNLSSLVGSIENLRVSVVTIAGPPKTGKSVLFGYLVRYFIAAEKDEIDWIDSDNPERSLAEIKWPRDNNSPDNPGIWSYHRPFILENDDGPKPEKIAVILLYTQSSDKCSWDRDDNESCSLIGLSLHISSNIIFNVYKYIDEECLATLGTSIKYALTTGSQLPLMKKGRSPPLPFQSTCFVIRDWNFPSEYQYGMKGGRDFVKIEKLKENKNHSRDSRENRQLINGLFQDVTGCLLPFPGQAAIQPGEFQGSINELGFDFSKHLTELINSQINIDQMIMKKDGTGKAVTGKFFKEMVERYINQLGDTDGVVMDTGKILRRFRIKVAISANEQRECMKPALKAYADVWRKYQKGGKVLDDKALRDIQKRARRKAAEAFENEVCGQGGDDEDDDMGSSDEDEQPEVDEKVKKQLFAKIVKRFVEIQKEEENKQKANVERQKVDILQQYRDSMSSLFSNSSRPPTEKVFRRESLSTIENLGGEFMEKLGAPDGDRGSLNERQEAEMENLMERLKEVEEEMFDGRFRNEGIEEDARPSLRRSTDSGFDKFNQTSHYSSTRMSSSLNRSTSSISSRRSDTSIDEAGNLLHENHLRREIPSKHAPLPSRESKEALRKQEESMKAKSKQLVDRLTQVHASKLDSQVEDIDADLEDTHNEHLLEIVEIFKNEIEYDQTRSEFSLYKGILEADCKSALASAKSKNKRMKKSKQSTAEIAKKLAVENYERQLEEFMAGNEHATMEDLQEKSEGIEEDEVDKLRGKVGRGHDDVITNAKLEMANIFSKFQSKLELKRQKTDDKLASNLSELKIEYGKRIKTATASVRNEKELEKEHNKIADELRSKLKKTGSVKNDQRIVRELGDIMNNLYIDAKQKMEIQNTHAKGTANLSVRHARDYYTTEMEKKMSNHRNMSHNELQKLHEGVCKAVLKKYPDADKAEVREMLKIAFRRFKDEVSMNSSDEPAIGIDLGTTYSCVALYQKGKVQILPNSIGKYTTPSYVLFKASGGEIIGEEAKTRAYENPEGTIFDAKRILGRRFDDPKLQDDMKLWPFSVVDGGRGIPMIEVNGKRLNPEIISSKILKQLKKDSEDFLKRKVTKAVITVPAYFTDGQKQATIDAGKMAGLEVLSILTEPVAAAMAYKLQYSDAEDEDRHILVFDLGGGTFDVAVLKASRGKLDVLTVDGDTHLGGEDFDKNMMNYCAQEFQKQHGIDLFDGKDSPKKNVRDDVRRRLKRLQAVCEMQKIALTTARSTDVTVDNIYKNMDLEVTVSRATFEKINNALFDTTIEVVENALRAAKVDKSKINDIVMVGGSTRIPKVQQLLKDYFNGKELDKKINPDEAVAHGAGLMAAIKQGSVGKTSAAYTKIQDVTPMSIGVEVYGGGFSPIIPKSTKTPVMLKERYKTAHNNQTSVQITIYEGEDKIAQKNKHLGDFYLNGIPPKAAGVENIDVEMLINDQGILHVTAKCSSTGTKNTVRVTENKQRMGQAAIKRYLAEAGP